MIYLLGTYEHALVAFIGVLFAFAATCIAIAKLNGYLPKDMGRQYAHDGALSAGKPRGAGIIFVLTFVVSALLFGKMNKEIIIYLVLIVIEMFTGFFDDAAEKPWGEYLKGILDLAVAVVVAISYLHYNSSEITIAITGTTIVIPPVVFAILTVILVWVSINVTNCSDGVDGLSGTLTIITLMSVFVLDNILKVNDSFNYCILLFAVCLLGYLWYNATPSKLLMGDAGSRAMGIFYCHCGIEDAQSVYVPAGCCGTYRRRWSWSGKGFTASVFKDTYSEEYHHTDPRPCKKKGWVVQCPGGISLCHHSDCNFTCSNLSGYDLSCSYNWRLYAFCFH